MTHLSWLVYLLHGYYNAVWISTVKLPVDNSTFAKCKKYSVSIRKSVWFTAFVAYSTRCPKRAARLLESYRNVVKRGICHQNVFLSVHLSVTFVVHAWTVQDNSIALRRAIERCLVSWGQILRYWIHGFTANEHVKQRYSIVNSKKFLPIISDISEIVQDRR